MTGRSILVMQLDTRPWWVGSAGEVGGTLDVLVAARPLVLPYPPVKQYVEIVSCHHPGHPYVLEFDRRSECSIVSGLIRSRLLLAGDAHGPFSDCCFREDRQL